MSRAGAAASGYQRRWDEKIGDLVPWLLARKLAETRAMACQAIVLAMKARKRRLQAPQARALTVLEDQVSGNGTTKELKERAAASLQELSQYANDPTSKTAVTGLKLICAEPLTARDLAGATKALMGWPIAVDQWHREHATLLREATAGVEEIKGPFSPQDSIMELELWARVNHPHIDWDIRQGHIDAMNPSLEQLAKLAELYPEAFAELERVVVEPVEVPADAPERDVRWIRHCFAHYGSNEITFNAKRYGDIATLEKRMAALNKKEWSRVTDLAGIVTHEFGHHLHGWLLEDPVKISHYEEDRQDLLTHAHYKNQLGPIVDGPLGTVGGTLSVWLEHNPEAISKYARASGEYAERFAEGFVSIHHDAPEQQPEFASQLGRVLTRLCDSERWHQDAIDLQGSSNPEAAASRSKYLTPLLLEFGLTPRVAQQIMVKAGTWSAVETYKHIISENEAANPANLAGVRAKLEENFKRKFGVELEWPEEVTKDIVRPGLQQAALTAPSLSQLDEARRLPADVPAAPSPAFEH
jgi:hypothetical protein